MYTVYIESIVIIIRWENVTFYGFKCTIFGIKLHKCWIECNFYDAIWLHFLLWLFFFKSFSFRRSLERWALSIWWFQCQCQTINLRSNENREVHKLLWALNERIAGNRRCTWFYVYIKFFRCVWFSLQITKHKNNISNH